MVKIRFIRQGSNSMLGGFSSGDFARVSEAVAKHLVDEALVAVYADPMQPAEAPAAEAPAAEAPAAEAPAADAPAAEAPAAEAPAAEAPADHDKTALRTRKSAAK